MKKKIANKIKQIGYEKCCAVAIQLSIIGFGNKIYGQVTYNNELIDIKDFFDQNKILYKSIFGDKLEEDTLTPRRIIRFFRFNIQKYILKKDIQSYLYKKYCPIKDDKISKRIFPGIEHLINNDDKNRELIVKALILSYENIDQKMNTNITTRIKRVLFARNIIY